MSCNLLRIIYLFIYLLIYSPRRTFIKGYSEKETKILQKFTVNKV